jgi:urea transport system ATP-binding protein
VRTANPAATEAILEPPAIQASVSRPTFPASGQAPLLSLREVEAFIDGSRILRGVDLDIRPGEIVALMGRAGVGKTTTLRVITGLLPLRGGSLLFGGRPFARLSPDARARAGVGYVPQGGDIFPHLTVEENLHIGLVVHRRGGGGVRDALERVFSLFPVLKEMLSRKGGVLSGGQQRQLAIGRALLADPRLLIIDEPAAGIRPSLIGHIGDTLRRLKNKPVRREPRHDREVQNALKVLRQEGRLAVLLVAQHVDFCRDVADRFYAMARGAVVASGPIAALTDEVVREHLHG